MELIMTLSSINVLGDNGYRRCSEKVWSPQNFKPVQLFGIELD
jgi:hypothetical protein